MSTLIYIIIKWTVIVLDHELGVLSIFLRGLHVKRNYI